MSSRTTPISHSMEAWLSARQEARRRIKVPLDWNDPTLEAETLAVLLERDTATDATASKK